ncbi:aspartate kinase [Candidatus Uhrbacteria bacterium]|nr:aspartate kinase [Candidatus Uhrbacteria bacterium]
MIVMKFGGTSVGTLEAMRQAADIVFAKREKHPIVVTSAMSGATDELLKLARLAASGSSGEAASRFDALKKKHYEAVPASFEAREKVIAELDAIFLELKQVLSGLILLRELTARSLDLIASCGERMAAPILAAYVSSVGVSAAAIDSRDGIITDDSYTSAEVDFTKTNERLRALILPLLRANIIPVVTGFIARSHDGATTTLGRGGSDYTAAILGAALGAEEIQIWTDVDGILSADPKIVPNAKILSEVSYAEAIEMSYFGAKVIHPKTMLPAFGAGIPIIIKNTFRPNSSGTRISKNAYGNGKGVKVVTAISKVSLITVSGLGLRGRVGFAAAVFEVASRERANIIMITQASSEQSICMIVDRADGLRLKAALERAFANEIKMKSVEGAILDENVSIVSVVGAGMAGTPGIAGKTFSAAAGAGVNILAIAQGSSELNISFAVAASDAEAAVKAIHNAFICPV